MRVGVDEIGERGVRDFYHGEKSRVGEMDERNVRGGLKIS